eukprot:7381183-Prymnesium_polylepis.1
MDVALAFDPDIHRAASGKLARDEERCATKLEFVVYQPQALNHGAFKSCLLYTSPSPRDAHES